MLDARQTPDQIASAVRVRVARLLSGLPLQQLAASEEPTSGTNGATVAHDHLPSQTPRHPHAQTGTTPQLHP